MEAVSVVDPSQRKRIELVAACSDYDQPRYPVAYAIDGNTQTGWAMDGRTDDHYALFYCSEPFGYEGGTELRLELEQRFGGQHNLGRVRLSVTNDREGLPAAFGVWRSMGPFVMENAALAFSTRFPPEEALTAVGDATGLSGSYDFSATYQFTSWQGKSQKLNWQPRPEWVDARLHSGLPGTRCSTYLARVLHAPTERRIELSLGSDDGVQVWLNGERLLSKDVPRGLAADQDRVALALRAGSNLLLLKVTNREGQYGFYCDRRNEDLGGIDLEEVALLSLPPEQLDSESKAQLQRLFRVAHSERHWQLDREISVLEKQLREKKGAIPKTLVMRELKKPKPAFLLDRGLYDQERERVEREVPAFLPSLPRGAPRDRLGFARWLTDPMHPLTARVTVNRLWQQLFGVGLVATAEDFGVQGERPTHPELLDALASDFRAIGLECQRTAAQAGDLCHLSTEFSDRRAALNDRSRQPLVVSRSPLPTRCRGHSRWRAGREWGSWWRPEGDRVCVRINLAECGRLWPTPRATQRVMLETRGRSCIDEASTPFGRGPRHHPT